MSGYDSVSKTSECGRLPKMVQT